MITLAVTLLIILTYVQTLTLLTAKIAKTPFTLDEALFEFPTSTLDIKWVSDTEFVYKNATTKDTIIYNAESNQSRILFEFSLIKHAVADFYDCDYELSDDKKYVLVSQGFRQVFRRTTKAKYSIYSTEEKWFFNLQNGSYLQWGQWGQKGNSLIYIYLNNIYYIPSASVLMSNPEPVRVTQSGIPNLVFNGIPDWVYEEEMYPVMADKALSFWLSPDGKRMMYIEYNDTNIGEMTYMDYGTDQIPISQYPKPITQRYPKSGTTNPTVSINYVDLSRQEFITESTVTWELNKNQVFRELGWINNNEIIVSIANRVQNETRILVCNVPSKNKAFESECNTLYEEKISGGWSDVKLPIFSKNGSLFINIVQQSAAESGNFDHLTLFDRNGKWSAPLTQGPVDDIDIVAWDEEHQLIYYRATDEKVPSRTHLYLVNPVNSNEFSAVNPTCLSCNISLPDESTWPKSCFSTYAQFSTNFTYVVITCYGPSPTMVVLYRNPIRDSVAVLVDNSKLKSKLKDKLLPDVLDYKVKINNKVEADVRLFFPPSGVIDSEKKYPLLINVYGAPEFNLIGEDFSIAYLHYLTTNLKIVYGYIDGRGSGRRGRNLLYATYRKLGTGEVEDQIQVTKYLQKTIPLIDANRTGIWGWSYGGYVTAKALQNDFDNVFKCGVSVAPISTLLLYDTLLAEKYMGLPTAEDNLENYIKGDIISNVSNIRNKKFYLIHGTKDDNVHYQNALLLSQALAKKNILFQQQIYADENHELLNVRPHLFNSMTEFWKNCFELK